jgi:hypothetical protein
MSEQNTAVQQIPVDIIEKLVLKGDLSGMDNPQRVQYYRLFCERLGLDPLTQPFKILNLQGKQILYCDRSGAQQLNKMHKVSHEIRSREIIAEVGVYQVTARASLPDGRFTDSIGAVNIQSMKGDAYANAIMKAETKAKRRSTLDLLGLGILDETETETIPNAIVEPPPIDVNALHDDFMKLYNDYVFISNDENATKFHPDNWKGERNAKNYESAIAAIKLRISQCQTS